MQMAIQRHSNNYNSWCLSTAVRKKLLYSAKRQTKSLCAEFWYEFIEMHRVQIRMFQLRAMMLLFWNMDNRNFVWLFNSLLELFTKQLIFIWYAACFHHHHRHFGNFETFGFEMLIIFIWFYQSFAECKCTTFAKYFTFCFTAMSSNIITSMQPPPPPPPNVNGNNNNNNNNLPLGYDK